MVVAVVHAEREFLVLHRGIGMPTPKLSLLPRCGTQCGGITLDACVLGGHDVQDTRHALGIVFGTGRRDDVNLLMVLAGILFEHLFRIVAHHRAGLTIHIDFKTAVAVHL